MLTILSIIKLIVFKFFVNLILFRGKGTYYVYMIIILLLSINSKRIRNLYPLLFCENLSDISIYEDDTNKNLCNQYNKKLDKKDFIQEEYVKAPKKNNFILNIDNTNASIPLFNLRTFDNLGFYYNFIFENFDSEKINNLVMCRDINKWMSKPALTNNDLEDDYIPIFFIKKQNNKVNVYEYLRLFIKTDKSNVKIAFVEKGNDYEKIGEFIKKILDKDLIKDLLKGNTYNLYNLSTIDGVNDFLDRLLSYVLPPENLIGNKMILDIEYYNENKKTYNYFFNNDNCEMSIFNSSL
jgi:hypothetical protein